MRGICGTLWILLQLEQQIQLAFRVFPHIDHPNENCNKTATSIPIDTVCVYVPALLYGTKLNSSFKSDLSSMLLYGGYLDLLNCDQCIMLLTRVCLTVDLISRSLNTASSKSFYLGALFPLQRQRFLPVAVFHWHESHELVLFLKKINQSSRLSLEFLLK